MVKLLVILTVVAAVAAAGLAAKDEETLKTIVKRQLYREDVKSMKGVETSKKNRYGSEVPPKNSETYHQGAAVPQSSYESDHKVVSPSKSHNNNVYKPQPKPKPSPESYYPKEVVLLQAGSSVYSRYEGPATSFDCLKLKNVDYEYLYPDYETGCKVFHSCQLDGRQDSFYCPEGTIFDGRVQTCDWQSKVSCKY